MSTEKATVEQAQATCASAPPTSGTDNKTTAVQATWVEMRNAKDLGRAIARQRKVLGYGLVDAAALCQVGTRFLFELEHGKATVEFDRALKVANRFGLRLKITGVE